MKIPFKFLPSSWGLKGKPYEEAEAYYYLEGKELDIKLAHLNIDDKKALDRKLLEISFKYGIGSEYDLETEIAKLDGPILPQVKAAIDLKFSKITQYDHDTIITDDLPDGDEKDLAKLGVELKHHKINQHEYDKGCATIKKEPYIGIVDDGFDKDKGINGVFFEFDWNDFWIEYLKMNGYTGETDDQIVERWFQDVCRSYALEEAANDQNIIPFR
jgi:hypothetical protein